MAKPPIIPILATLATTARPPYHSMWYVPYPRATKYGVFPLTLRESWTILRLEKVSPTIRFLNFSSVFSSNIYEGG